MSSLKNICCDLNILFASLNFKYHMLSSGFIGTQIHLQVALELENKESYYKLIKEESGCSPRTLLSI